MVRNIIYGGREGDKLLHLAEKRWQFQGLNAFLDDAPKFVNLLLGDLQAITAYYCAESLSVFPYFLGYGCQFTEGMITRL